MNSRMSLLLIAVCLCASPAWAIDREAPKFTFVEVLLSGPYQAEADMNEDQVVNGLDVDPFVAAVVGGGAHQIPEPSTLLLCIIALSFMRKCCSDVSNAKQHLCINDRAMPQATVKLGLRPSEDARDDISFLM